MGKNARLDALWSKIMQASAELSKVAKDCKTGEPSAAYKTLKRDLEKLKAEYEKEKGEVINHNDLGQMERLQRRRVFGDTMGKTSSDSHHRLEDR
jgi:hypothetical protein